MSDVKIQRALLSVSDKAGLAEFAAGLHHHGVELVSTGGTARAIAEAGLPVREVAELTGFPEIMDGRVKTLHPVVHGGILARRDVEAHVAVMTEHGIGGIDLVVVNLYPFEATVGRGAAWDEIVENVDIGGPAMIRSAAKNHAHVAVLVDPADYTRVLSEMDAKEGATSLELRVLLAAN
ncbi:MAG: bifunctional phosphoribosylaminoimidazolecarboxamide formyltransferase/IMP cyclohydrolase, partial [Rhodospirillaceae bacterium]|nr:bifunctional phosphoribosylaminoimidazolecarboxamide formyltransferase/IMP cyclohydrolase [Rhodospirillaceae bacterium]